MQVTEKTRWITDINVAKATCDMLNTMYEGDTLYVVTTHPAFDWAWRVVPWCTAQDAIFEGENITIIYPVESIQSELYDPWNLWDEETY